MIDVVVGVIVNLIAFTAIGIGPSLILLSNDDRIEVAVCIAPVVGFLLTGIFGTWLILLDKPVSAWALPWLTLSILMSFVLCLIRLKSRFVFDQPMWRVLVLFLSGLFLTILFVVAPMIIGGLDFTVLRGNGTDTFNYITMSEYLDREPYSWVSKVSTEILFDRHPSYVLARLLLGSRWTTSAVLAWTARIAHIPIYRFEYGFTILSFILAYGPAFIFARLMRVRQRLALFLAIAICAGFWAQFVLDIRAISQMNSIPLVLLLAVLIERIYAQCGLKSIGAYVLFSVVFSGVILYYPEIIPMVVLGIALFIGLRVVNKGNSRILGFAIAIVASIIMTLPSKFLFSFLRDQLNYAALGQNTWHKAYFGWLYSNPFTGFWGLSYVSVRNGVLNWVPVGMNLLGILMSLMLILGIVRFVLKGKFVEVAVSIAAMFFLASLIQFTYLLIRGQLWAAGKGLSMGYPFMMMTTVACIPNFSQLLSGGKLVLARIGKYSVFIWISIQCILGGYRIGFSYVGEDYRGYIGHHGSYRQHDWNVESFLNVIRKKKDASVWVSVSDPWLAEYLSFVLGWDMKLVNLDAGRVGEKTGLEKMIYSSDYMIVGKVEWYTGRNGRAQVVAENSELLLIRVTDSLFAKPMLMCLHNPNGIENNSDSGRFFWMGGSATQLKLYSPREGYVNLNVRLVAGPSLPERPDRTISVRSNLETSSMQYTVTDLTTEIRIPVRQGVNEVYLQVADKPTLAKLSNGDTRPLLLGMRLLSLNIQQ